MYGAPGGYGPPQGYGPPPGYTPPGYGYPAPPGPPNQAPRTSGLAVTSLVTGICALVCGLGSWVCCFLVFLAAPAALVLAAISIPMGGVAISQIRRSGGTIGGNGMAIAGLICGVVALIPTVLWVVFIGWTAATSP
jgi:hypothetical protein